MRLTTLHPRWVPEGVDRQGLGLSFDCPHCVRTGSPVSQRLVVWFKNPVDAGPPQLGMKTYWYRFGNNFEKLTIAPSIDASTTGHWHGYLANGEVE